MKSRLALLALAALIPAVARTATPAAAEPSADARRLASILDYVAGDYGEAVQGGVVVDAHELEEQLEFLEEAEALGARLGPADFPIVERIRALEAEAKAHVGTEDFATDARALRREVVARYHVEVAPAKPPVYARGAALYAAHCASCHGATGAADTDAARALTPPPRNFRDAEVMASITPSRAFNAITYGVDGTAMAPFPALSADERWDLAFTVLALRFGEAEAARGAAVAGGVGLADLADRTDAELLARLPPAADREAAVAWLRRKAPFTGSAPTH